MQIKTTNNRQNIKLDLLAYGLPNTEKTLSIARLQHAGFNPFVIACDPGGMSTLGEFNIPFIEIDKIADLYLAIGAIRKGQIDLRPYDLICLDGATNLSYMCLKATGENSPDRRLDYARGYIDFRRLIDDIRRFPMHVYMNAHEVLLKDGKYGAMCEGAKYAIQFTGLMNHVINMRRVQVQDNNGNVASKVIVQTSDDGVYTCRVRNKIVNMYEPTIVEAVQKILTI
ncbi:hypothetical protein QJS24_gp35 [Serratia phage vB_SmaS_Rovert]|uniref:Uncharacterized protein n=1 Tax=Serratia phage vB_SmaS_Rovert TaxID=2777363 RepID=A0A7T3N9T0_9CAUD|nr:hypothetical protein QJS24_gp35 [Serratia phage vB_SmaS_Rovert]QPX75003.1 hypothetical protein [Serratia phage vB_SmaS_Rovert]